MKAPGIYYGHDRDGTELVPVDGEHLIIEGTPLPDVHRAWINGHGWTGRSKFLHTHPGANLIAQVFGNIWAYSAPDEVTEPNVPDEVASATEPILDVPEVVSVPEIEPVVVDTAPKPVIQKKTRIKPPASGILDFDE